MAEPVIAGRYEVVDLLGRGGMGSVYEARHIGTGRRVAVKVITPELAQNRHLLGRFEIEARAAGALESDHIAQVFDVGFDERRGSPFLVMEYLEGEDLSELLLRVGTLEPELALALFAQACKGLEKAHKKGIVHRDIKPANLFLSEVDDDLRRLKILDFGIAKMISDDDAVGASSVVRSSGLVGSPLYMSPEQARARGGVDHRSDLWSIGVVLYEMLTGRAPFAHLEAVGDLIIAICSEPVPPLRQLAPGVSPEIETIVMKALSVDVSARYQQASEMVAAARALLPNGFEVSASLLLPSAHRHLTGEQALSVPFALSKAVSAAVEAPSPLSEGATIPRFVPPPATTRTTSAAVSDTTAGVTEPSSQRVAVMGAVGVLIGASVTLAIGLQLVGVPSGSDAVAHSASATAAVTAAAVAPAVSAAASIEVTPVPSSATATGSASALASVSAAASSATAAETASGSVSAAPKLTGRLPVAPPPPKPTAVELYDL